MRSALLQFRRSQVALVHLRTHVAANPVKHRLAPWEGFSAAVQVAIATVAPELVHNVLNLQAKVIRNRLAGDRHKFRQVRSKGVAITATLYARVYDPLKLDVSES